MGENAGIAGAGESGGEVALVHNGLECFLAFFLW